MTCPPRHSGADVRGRKGGTATRLKPTEFLGAARARANGSVEIVRVAWRLREAHDRPLRVLA